ncbi:PREDICTED: ras guanine nucleotide exchange factor Q-like [Amphimedon queenslandica]|uniref:Ras-GEF domain-containing protein n=1 Tax=Amphimedon queenslandica TaxID=400682 RepID=A0A1X7ULI2_AMPQE|nr:PREDICTED: ras guanine nucleotide exchange factor Q-like [Amphimedon queenslandica]|eukprot:XP_011404744.2 PREDICTED: ras guanine nucleotide exchange factor Q-like [Amphimedon queenslandica]
MCSLTASSLSSPLPMMPEEKKKFKKKGGQAKDRESNPQRPQETELVSPQRVLAEEFTEIKAETDSSDVVKLYLTDSELVVAKNEGGQLRHVRTHSLRKDSLTKEEREGKLTLTVQEGDNVLFNYKMNKDDNHEEWLQRISSLSQVDTVSSLPVRLPILIPDKPTPPTVRIQRPSREWHGETFSSKETAQFMPSKNRIKSSPLRRREAFRPRDIKRFSFHRSSSAPPEDEDQNEEIVPFSPSHLKENDKVVKSSPSSRNSSLKKTKLMSFSPKAHKFTRALSAKLMNANTSLSAHTSPKPNKKDVFKRGHSFHSEVSTASLPRSLPNKYVRKSQTVYVSQPKSPGSSNLFKVFQRKRIHSVTSGLEQVDSGERSKTDLFSRPNCSKLYLQDPQILAEELSLIDSEMFRKISISELIDNAWMNKKSKQSTSPNVLAMIQAFNRIACIVCTEVVHERCLQTRGKVISKYITLAGRCYKLHNYNSMKAILSGLQSQAVFRLKRSWNHVPSKKRKKYQRLSAIIDSDEVQREMEINLQNRVQCVPYLGWLLTNIVHWKDYKSLRMRSESFSKETKRNKWSHRASVCSVSMPTSPVNDDDSTLLHSTEVMSRSLCDMLQVNYKTTTVTHPLLLSISPPSQEFLQVKGAITSASDSDSSIKADSAIGLDSSMSQASPERKSEVKKKQSEEAVVAEDEEEDRDNYCLPVLEQHFDDSETEEDCLSSLSSSTLSLTSPFTTLPSRPQKRRVTLPIHPPSSSPPPRVEVCLHSDTSGTLFSSCPVHLHSPLYDFDESTICRLSAVARQLLLDSNEECTTDSASKEVVNEKDESTDHPLRDAMLTLFEQYQVNTLSYLTDYSSNAKVRHLIMEAPWIDDGVCHAVSLQVEP